VQNQGFGRRNRLRVSRVFARARELASRTARGPITIHAIENGLDHARLGLSIGRRSLPRAVDRNRLKRLAREVFRKGKGRYAGYDIVITLRGLVSLSAHTLNQIEGQLRKIFP
jgi:ribonuclease P protein component